MAYTSLTLVEAKIPASVLTDALDDNGDGKQDAGLFDDIVAAASQEINGYLSGLYPVPFPDPAPQKVQSAAFVFVCEAIFQRRNVPDEKNPYAAQAKWWRDHLQAVGNRDLPLDAATDKAFEPGAAHVTPISLNSQTT
jgi:phage gp36-like protein